VLLSGYLPGDKNSKMADILMDRVDYCLTAGADFLDILVEIENPAERLLRWGNVVALLAKHDNRRTDIAEIDHKSITGLNSARGKIIADE